MDHVTPSHFSRCFRHRPSSHSQNCFLCITPHRARERGGLVGMKQAHPSVQCSENYISECTSGFQNNADEALPFPVGSACSIAWDRHYLTLIYYHSPQTQNQHDYTVHSMRSSATSASPHDSRSGHCTARELQVARTPRPHLRLASYL